MVHQMPAGKNTRLSYSKIKEVLEVPNLIDVQKSSYKWFLEEGLKEVFRDISPIADHDGKLALEFFDYHLDYEPRFSVTECKNRDAKYAAPLRVNVRLINTTTGEIKEQEIFMGDFPLMTEQGTFIINGAERVVVSQLVRSPGMYYEMQRDRTGKPLYNATIIPYRGAWIEYESDANDIFSVRIDRTRKLPVTVFMRAMGVETDARIIKLFGDDPRIINTLEKDPTRSKDEAMLEIYKKLRPGEPLNVENAESLITNMFFDPKRYDLAHVGRYKYNKKVALSTRLRNHTLARDVVDPITGEVLASAGDEINKTLAMAIEDAGINEAYLFIDEKEVKIFSNNMVNYARFNPYYDIKKDEFDALGFGKVYKPALEVIIEEAAALDGTDEDRAQYVLEQSEYRQDELVPKHITTDDMMASINYLLSLANGAGKIDDIDHLGNRRIRCVGELLQNQFRIGLARMERVVRERMSVQDTEIITPQTLINVRPITATINEFFGSSQLSQFMDQPNPLAELRHKRRISALGPGGLSRERAGFEVRDVHYSHYGRMCPIETPEGPNIGLITSLATFARINEYGFVEAPYRRVEKEFDEKGKVKSYRVTDEIEYMSADTEDEYIVAQANEPLDENGVFISKHVSARYRDEILEVSGERIDYMDVSPRQLVSVVTACIPFLENDDANRALMGSNMQCQAVPLLTTDSPIVGTGMECKVGSDAGSAVIAREDGVVEKLDADKIIIRGASGETYTHDLIKFARSNQSTCINQRPIVEIGENVKAGQVIADGSAMSNGELALGKNILIGFMTWEGYNYEDAVLISEELVMDDVFTSIHIEEYECESRDTKLGPEEITRDIPNVSDDSLADLDEDGVIRIGAEVRPGDVLVGKVTPKGETELTAEERLLRAIFGEKAREVRDTSLRVPHGESGIIVDVKKFSRENGDELPSGVNESVRCYIAQKRKISVGDKMAGRHGNKGVVSRVLPKEDMPFLADGTPLQIVLNPLGVPSRMNIGQVLEMHLGYAFRQLSLMPREEIERADGNPELKKQILELKDKLDGNRFNYIKLATPVFDGAHDEDIQEAFKLAGLRPDFKSAVYDGRTGEKFDNDVTVGVMYYLKLDHLVDDKIHARSTGPYSLVTQQPLGGKAQFGGQRFGEMEVWALEAYGAAYTLQEILTVKSDDVVGRVRTYEAIVKGENIPRSGVPESFRVLVKELQSLALDIKILDGDKKEINIDHIDDDDMLEPDSELLSAMTGDIADPASEGDVSRDMIIENGEDDLDSALAAALSSPLSIDDDPLADEDFSDVSLDDNEE